MTAYVSLGVISISSSIFGLIFMSTLHDVDTYHVSTLLLNTLLLVFTIWFCISCIGQASMIEMVQERTDEEATIIKEGLTESYQYTDDDYHDEEISKPKYLRLGTVSNEAAKNEFITNCATIENAINSILQKTHDYTTMTSFFSALSGMKGFDKDLPRIVYKLFQYRNLILHGKNGVVDHSMVKLSHDIVEKVKRALITAGYIDETWHVFEKRRRPAE